MALDEAWQAALDLATLTARDVDLAMRAELEAHAAVRLAEAELVIANARWENAREALEAARTRFGVGWPNVRRILEHQAPDVSSPTR